MQVLLDRGHNRHLVFVTKDKPMLCPYSNRLVSLLWNTSNGIAQKHKLRGRWTSYTTPIAKVLLRTWCCWVRQDSDSKSSIQNLMQLSTGYSATPYQLIVWLWIKCLYPEQNTMVFCHGLKQPVGILKIYVLGSHISMAAQWSPKLMEILISAHRRLGLIDCCVLWCVCLLGKS